MFSTMIEKFVKTGIINPQDISLLEEEVKNIGNRIVFVDATFVLPTSTENIHDNFKNKRIGGAVFFDIKSVADKSSPLPHMLPDETTFEQAMSALGIRNDDTLILYGQHGMIMGPARVWWMFKGFGHDNVLVMNGGLPAWEKAGLETTSGPEKPLEKSHYKAKPFNTSMVTDINQVLESSTKSSCPIIDARPAERFCGETPEPRAGMRAGHIPNSLNLPCSALVDITGQFKAPEQLDALFKEAGITHEKCPRIMTTCGSGITACALALALYHLGYENVAVYDGSWSEWGLESAQTKVKTA